MLNRVVLYNVALQCGIAFCFVCCALFVLFRLFCLLCVCFVLFDLFVLRCRLCFVCSWRFCDVITYPYAWTVNFEMRLEGIDSACILAGRSERISAGDSVSMSADGSNFMLASNSVDISIICRRSKNVPFPSTTLYQNLDFLAPKHQTNPETHINAPETTDHKE